MNRHSLTFKMTILIGLFTLLVLMIVATTFYVVNTQSADATVIDVAGRQRLLIHKINKESMELISALESESSTKEIRKNLRDLVSLFETSLAALRDGGVIKGTDNKETRLPGSTGEARNHLSKALEIWKTLRPHLDVITDSNVDVVSDTFFTASERLSKEDTDLLQESSTAALLLKEASEKKTSFLKTVQATALILTIIASAISWFFTNRFIVTPIVQTTSVMEKVADKDLTSSISFSDRGEIGRMGLAVNRTIDNFRDLFGQIIESSSNLASSSEELAAAAVQIDEGTQQQSERTSKVASSCLEISATSTEVANSTSSTSQAAEDMNKMAAGSGELVQKSIKSIKYVADTTQEMRNVIFSLSDSSKEIGEVAHLIEGIAGQTNLLALNAAIEAARAGKQGRGFAVVADEVRKLSERTATATKDIGEMISSIQSNAHMALTSIEKEIHAVEEGVKLVMDVGSELGKIVENVEMISPLIQQIATSAEEQAQSTEAISKDIETVAQITKDTVSSSGAIAQSSQEIAKLASQLQTFVVMFKLSETQTSLAKAPVAENAAASRTVSA